MYAHWNKRFGEILGKTVVLLTGDAVVDIKLIESAQIIITTCLNYDSLSRRWKQRKVLQSIQLYIADELHLLGSTVGPIYEVVLSRIRYMASQLETHLRTIIKCNNLQSLRNLFAKW